MFCGSRSRLYVEVLEMESRLWFLRMWGDEIQPRPCASLRAVHELQSSDTNHGISGAAYTANEYKTNGRDSDKAGSTAFYDLSIIGMLVILAMLFPECCMCAEHLYTSRCSIITK